jgi:hypothetical protein
MSDPALSGTSLSAVPIEDPADQRPEAFTAYLGISLRQLGRFIEAGLIPPPDVVLSRKCRRWRRSTVARWRASQAKKAEGQSGRARAERVVAGAARPGPRSGSHRPRPRKEDQHASPP